MYYCAYDIIGLETDYIKIREGIMNHFAFLNLGTPELLLILLIALLLFGGRKLPELAKSLGTSARELRKGLDGDEKDHKQTSEKTQSKSTS
jgi:sec-independent protein translocase protein TatA